MKRFSTPMLSLAWTSLSVWQTKELSLLESLIHVSMIRLFTEWWQHGNWYWYETWIRCLLGHNFCHLINLPLLFQGSLKEKTVENLAKYVVKDVSVQNHCLMKEVDLFSCIFNEDAVLPLRTTQAKQNALRLLIHTHTEKWGILSSTTKLYCLLQQLFPLLLGNSFALALPPNISLSLLYLGPPLRKKSQVLFPKCPQTQKTSSERHNTIKAKMWGTFKTAFQPLVSWEIQDWNHAFLLYGGGPFEVM